MENKRSFKIFAVTSIVLVVVMLSLMIFSLTYAWLEEHKTKAINPTLIPTVDTSVGGGY